MGAPPPPAHMRHMMKRLVLAAVAALSFTPAFADVLSLGQISTYLNSLDTVQTRFVQTNPDGSRDTGTLSIKRPNRARFEYDPPNKALVIAGGGAVAVFDEWNRSDPDQYPLKRTPLNLILGANIDLSKARMVVDHKASGDRTLVVAQDPDHPDYGQIGLYFEQNPVRLAEWVIFNEMGEATKVQLDPFVEKSNLSTFLFSIPYETEERAKR